MQFAPTARSKPVLSGQIVIGHLAGDEIEDQREQDHDLRKCEERDQERPAHQVEQHPLTSRTLSRLKAHPHDKTAWRAAALRPRKDEFGPTESDHEARHSQYALRLNSIHSEKRKRLVKEHFAGKVEKHPRAKRYQRDQDEVDPKGNDPSDQPWIMRNLGRADRCLWQRSREELCAEPPQHAT